MSYTAPLPFERGEEALQLRSSPERAEAFAGKQPPVARVLLAILSQSRRLVVIVAAFPSTARGPRNTMRKNFKPSASHRAGRRRQSPALSGKKSLPGCRAVITHED